MCVCYLYRFVHRHVVVNTIYSTRQVSLVEQVKLSDFRNTVSDKFQISLSLFCFVGVRVVILFRFALFYLDVCPCVVLCFKLLPLL